MFHGNMYTTDFGASDRPTSLRDEQILFIVLNINILFFSEVERKSLGYAKGYS